MFVWHQGEPQFCWRRWQPATLRKAVCGFHDWFISFPHSVFKLPSYAYQHVWLDSMSQKAKYQPELVTTEEGIRSEGSCWWAMSGLGIALNVTESPDSISWACWCAGGIALCSGLLGTLDFNLFYLIGWVLPLSPGESQVSGNTTHSCGSLEVLCQVQHPSIGISSHFTY